MLQLCWFFSTLVRRRDHGLFVLPERARLRLRCSQTNPPGVVNIDPMQSFWLCQLAHETECDILCL